MDELKRQLADLEAQKSKLFEEGPVDQVQVSRLNAQIKELQGQIASAEKVQEQIEEKVHSEGIPFAVDGVDFTDLPPAVITFVEAVVKADRRRIYAEHATEIEQWEQKLKDAEQKQEQSDEQLSALKKAYEAIVQESADRQAQIAKLTAENAEISQNRDNAAAIIAEKDKEIARLNSHLDDFRKAEAYGEKQAQSIIDVTPTEKDDIQAAKDAVKKLYATVENWGSINKVVKPDGSFELVKNADLEQWAPVAPSLGGSNDTVSFPGQDQGDAAVGGVQAPAVVTPPAVGGTFQDENAVVGLAETDASAPLAGKTLEERVAELEKAVFGGVKNGVTAA